MPPTGFKTNSRFQHKLYITISLKMSLVSQDEHLFGTKNVLTSRRHFKLDKGPEYRTKKAGEQGNS